jgi:hypothetical protein
MRPTPLLSDLDLDRARLVRRIRDEVRAGEYRVDVEALAVAMVARAGSPSQRRAVRALDR